VAQVWDKLIDIDYFAWLGGGGTGGVDRFDDLLDTFSYTGNAGKAVVVDNSELKLVPITLYNKRLFTELEDAPNALVPNKMVVVNEAGTELILQDQPELPEQLLNSVGYFDYEDLTTSITPLSATSGVALKLTNDTDGANTNTSENPYGVSFVWDFVDNQFNFNELSIGDTIDIRVHIKVTTTTSNQRVDIKARLGVGSASQFDTVIYSGQFKSSGVHEISFVAPFYIGSEDILENPAELYLTTDANASVRVYGWYVRIIRRNVNIITVDYTVPDATNLVKGIVRLGGDLSGTADVPTVPGLATKVPNTRTITPSSPLTGGGALSSDLVLGIQQGGSTQSGFITSTDWNRFESAYEGKVNSISVSGTATKTLTMTKQDGTTLTATWTDINTGVWGQITGFLENQLDLKAALDLKVNTSRTITTTAPLQGGGTLGSDRTLSITQASSSVNGFLSSTDWNTFNGKQNAINGTGFVRASGTTISYDNTTYTPTARTIDTTSPLQGGGDMSANRTLSILQSSGTVSGFLSSTDWNTFNGKQDFIAAGTTAQYYRGDKTFQTLDKTAVGLANIDNTSDLNKPISTATQTALNLKQNNLSGSGIVKSTAGVISYLTDNTANWDAAYNERNNWDGGSTNLNASTGRSSLGASIVGSNLFTSTNPSAIRFLRANADNSISWLDAATFRTAIGAGTSSTVGTVTSVSALTLGTTGTDITSTVANGTTTPVITLNIPTASATNRGALSSTDWNTFNQKLSLSGGMLENSGAVYTLGIQHTSGSGIALIISKGGDGAALQVSKISGSGNAASITGGITLLSELNLITKLADEHINSAATWNAKIGGSGTTNYLPKFTGGSTLGNSQIFDNGTNVGIGTTSPSGKLEVNGGLINVVTTNPDGTLTEVFRTQITGLTGTSNWRNSIYASESSNPNNSIFKFSLANSQTTQADVMTLLGTGNVGIGTESPAVRLDFGNSVNQAFHLYTSGVDYYGLNMAGYDGSAFSTNIFSGDGGLIKFRTASGTSTQSTRMTINAVGNVGIGTTSPVYKFHVNDTSDAIVGHFSGGSSNYTLISFLSNEPNVYSTSLGSFNSGMLFRTGATDRMYIDSSGNVGIGTTSPLLTATSRGNVTINGTTSSVLTLGINEVYGGYLFADSTKVEISSNTQPIAFAANGSERMRITSGGNVGIGTTSPTKKLDVNGTAKVSGIMSLPNMPYYESNNAALSGGLTYGDLYYTVDSGLGTVRIVVNLE
jgi:hypothetical protein